MKERLSNVLAWFAFIHASICAIALILGMLGTKMLFDQLDFYFDLVGFDGAVKGGLLVYSPLIWTLLYVLDGKPRFLPWTK